MQKSEKHPTPFDKEIEIKKFEKLAKINQKFSVKNQYTNSFFIKTFALNNFHPLHISSGTFLTASIAPEFIQ